MSLRILALRKRKSNDLAGEYLIVLVASSRSDDEKLASGFFPKISRRSGEATRWQLGHPKLCTAIAVKSAKFAIAGGGNENQSPVSNDGAADVRRAGFWHAFFLKLIKFA